MAEKFHAKKQPAGFTSKLLRDLFGTNGCDGSRFSYNDEISPIGDTDDVENMQADVVANNNWQLIEEKLQVKEFEF